jgi:hypothetical protein
MKKPTWKVYIRNGTKDDRGYTDAPVGSMLDYDGFVTSSYYGMQPLYDAMDPFEFVDTLEIDNSYRGRSAAGFNLVGSKGEHYVIRISEMTKLLKEATIRRGKVSGRWGFVKQGANYSLTYRGDYVPKPKKARGPEGTEKVL